MQEKKIHYSCQDGIEKSAPVITRQASWCRLVILGTDVSIPSSHYTLVRFPRYRLASENERSYRDPTPLSRNSNSPLEQIQIFLAWRNQTPHRGVLPILPSTRVYLKKRLQGKEMRDCSGYRKCKIKLSKVLSNYNNALCDKSKRFFTTINPGDMGPLDILRKVWRNSQI